MDQQTIRDIMSGRRRGLGAGVLRAGAWALSKPYALLMRLRRRLYRLGLLPAMKAGAPVVSIGNLTTGGTGKTPMVAWVADRLKTAGRDVAILTRGYKGRGGTGDEAELLYQLTGSPVIVNPDRVSGAASAVEAGADALVLDDGFQHQHLQRDLDIVLIDATNPFGYNHCLPRGMLREPASALRDADAVVVTRSDQAPPEELAVLRRRLARLAPRAIQCLAAHVPTGLADARGRRAPASALAGRKVCAFCGLGNPAGFFDTVARTGAVVVEKIAFDDHAEYDSAAIEKIVSAARAAGAEALVTSAKDRVKLALLDPQPQGRPQAAALPLPLWTLLVAIGIAEGEAPLTEAIRRAVGR